MRGWGRLWVRRSSVPGLRRRGLARLRLRSRLRVAQRRGTRQEQKQHGDASMMAGQIRSFTRCAKMRSCPMSELERESHLLEL
jgi:hypothetical protein